MSLLSALLVFTAASLPGAANGPYERWALITSPDVSQSGLADLLLIEMRGLGLTLVERDEIDKVLGEFELVDALGAEQAEGRLRLGRLLNADALLIVRSAPSSGDETPQLDLLISDCVYGARLRVDRIPYESAHPDNTTAAVLDAVRGTREQFPEGVQQIVCIPPFVSRSLEHKFDYLQSRLAFLLQAAIARQTGVAMLEVSEARNIQRELDIGGDTLKAVATPLFVEGDYRVAWNADRKADDYALHVHVSGAGREPQDFGRQFPDLDSLAEALRSDVAEKMLSPALSGQRQDVSDAVRIARLAARSDAFARLDLLDEAIEMRQALLLLHPDDGVQALRLIGLYKLRFEQRIDWNGEWDVKAADLMPVWLEQLEGWRQALDVLERAVRHKSLTQLEVLYTLSDLATMLTEFREYKLLLFPSRFGGGALYQSGLDSLAECAAAYRRFATDVVPTIRKLPVGEVKVEQPWFPKPAAEPEAYAMWLRAQLTTPEFDTSTRDSDGPDISVRALQRMVHVMTTYADDAPNLNQVVFGEIESLTLDPTWTTDATAADLEVAIAQLEASPLEMNKYYAEFLRVGMHYKFPPEGQKPARTRRSSSFRRSATACVRGSRPIRKRTCDRSCDRRRNCCIPSRLKSSNSRSRRGSTSSRNRPGPAIRRRSRWNRFARAFVRRPCR